MHTKEIKEYNKFFIWICILALISGLSLCPLLPIGFFENLDGIKFRNIFFSHIAIQLIATFCSIIFFFYLANKTKWGMLFCLFPFLYFFLIILFLGFLPITARDALIHHLAVPKWWLAADTIKDIAWHEWSYYPMLLNFGYLGLLYYKLEQLTPLYHFSYLIITAAVIASFCYYKTRGSHTALLSYFFSLSLPITIKLASSPLVDLGLILYSTIAILFSIYWIENKLSLMYGIAVGMALGLACSIKFNGLLCCLVFALTFIIFAKQSGKNILDIILDLIMVSCVAIIVYMPWMIKNFYFTSNPFFPLFKSFFGVTIDSAASIPSLSPLAQRLVLYQESWVDLILMPIKMIFLGEDNNPRFYDGVLSPILLLAFVPLIKFKKNPWILFLMNYSLVYFLMAVFLSGARIRYLAPSFGPLLVLTSLGVYYLGDYKKGYYRRLINNLAGLFCLGFSGFYAFNLLIKQDALRYFFSEYTQTQYLKDHIPEYTMIDYLNHQNIKKGETVYLLYTGNRFYYYDVDIISGGHFSERLLISWLRQSQNTKLFLNELKLRGIKYFLTHSQRTQAGLNNNLTPQEKDIWSEFYQNHLKLVKDDASFSLWAVE